MTEDILPPKDFDVQEVTSSSTDSDIKVEEGGTINLDKQLEILERVEKLIGQSEKRRIRNHITYLILVLTFAWIILGLIDYLRTGNTFLLVSSWPTSGPILIVMGYFFGDHLLQKYFPHSGSS